MLATLLLFATTAAATPDQCRVSLPDTLQRKLEVEHPEHRLPADGDSACQLERRPRCLLGTSGDFNGDGKADYALIMPSRSGEAPPLFLVAFATNSGWRVQQLPIGSIPRVDGYFLRTLPRGTYHETEAVLSAGETGRTVKSKTDGILLATCESWETAYFYIGRHWVALALSD